MHRQFSSSPDGTANTSRRAFLAQTGKAALASLVAGAAAAPLRAAEVKYPAYENNLQDRLWMWGHDPGAYDGPKGVYNIPLSAPMSMAEGIKSMGIPNVCVIRGGTPDEEYRAQFKDVKRIAWNLSGGSNPSYYALKEYVFGLRDIMPNLTGYYLDDFFHGGAPRAGKDSETKPAPASLSIDEMRKLHEEMVAYKRRLDLAVVLYNWQLYGRVKPVMKYVDVVSLWIRGSDVPKIEESFERYHSLIPDKPTLLGLYMWNFYGKKELPKEWMAKQLDYAYRLYREGKIEGLIFHCTPLCNKGLAAVDYTRDWIAKHGKEGR